MKKRTKIFILTIFLISFVFTVFAIIPPSLSTVNNPFIIEEGQSPLVAAHRGGKALNPENTMKAIAYAVNTLKVDIVEVDLLLTKDNHLVLNHNKTINATSDVNIILGNDNEYIVNDHTLEELQYFNFGYNFKDLNGNYPYRDLLDNVTEDKRSEVLYQNGLRICTAEELLEKYYQTDLLYILEIKDRNELGIKACDVLYQLLVKYDLIDKVIIGTFNKEVEDYLASAYPNTLRGGSLKNVTNFVVTQLLGVNIFDNSSFHALQVPMKRNAFGINIKLDNRTIIDRAHRRNISCQFWTINDKEEMHRVISVGADVIITDYPNLLLEVISEVEQNKINE